MKFSLALVCCLIASFAFAQETAPAAAAESGFRAEYIKQINDVESHLVQLAEATPADKYSWRPAEGVRSISEVYIHVVGGNYFLPKFAGVEPPEGKLNREMEKTVTEKEKVIALLKESFDHVRNAMKNTTDADLDKPVEYFGKKSTVRDLYFTLAMHMHEHLGQSIAYARSNGIVPPWSAKEG